LEAKVAVFSRVTTVVPVIPANASLAEWRR
jgi:hypothetical protein